MMENRTVEVFNATAGTYDPARRKLIPCFDDFYQVTIHLIPSNSREILDLGAGTGLLSALVRNRFPDASLHLVDNSAQMLAQARQRFHADRNIEFQLADYTHALPVQQYDAIVSALSIHHLDDTAKRKLFRSLYAALKPSGIFINAEQILAPTAQLEEQAKTAWLAEVHALGATEEDVAASMLRQTEDRCATISDQLCWMQEAGLKDVRCSFQQGRFAVLSGIR